MLDQSAPTFMLSELRRLLTDEDDAGLWHAVLTTLVKDVELLLADYKAKDPVLMRIGPCSHWLRPHQTRWTAAGGFAWPTGYGDGQGGYSLSSLPDLEAARRFEVDPEAGTWHDPKGHGRRPLVLRVAIPTRTARHQQAAVHTIWTPGSPRLPTEKRVRFLGYRLEGDAWTLVADSLPLWG